MASTRPLPSFLLPHGVPRTAMRLFPRRNGYQPRLSPSSTAARSSCQRTYASSTSSSKSRVLSKPDKFRPPSHASRRVTKKKATPPRNYPGPKPTAEEEEAKKTRRYPNMFPPEGTLLYRFLTNKTIHFIIPMGVLFSLATYTFTHNFKQNSPAAHLLPPWSGLIFRPIDTIGQFFFVIRMDAHHNTLQSKEKRRRNVDDVEKRRAYRIAHGLEEPELETQNGEDGNIAAVAAPAEGEKDGSNAGQERTRRPVKKWFGIW